MPGERPQPSSPPAVPPPERPRRWYQPPWQLVSAAVALGMGVGTIGAIALQDPLVTRYVVVDVRPIVPPAPTAPTGPEPGSAPDGTPTGTTEARVTTGRATASVREAWLRARHRPGQDTAGTPPATSGREGARRPLPSERGKGEGSAPAPEATPQATPQATPGPIAPPPTAGGFMAPRPATDWVGPGIHPTD
jgi:hypothetical protein